MIDPSLPEHIRSHDQLRGAGFQEFRRIVRAYASPQLQTAGISTKGRKRLRFGGFIFGGSPPVQQDHMAPRKSLFLIKAGVKGRIPFRDKILLRRGIA